MPLLKGLMEKVSLKKVCLVTTLQEVYELQTVVEMATEANNSLAPDLEALNANKTLLSRAQQLLDMKEMVLKDEMKLKSMLLEREKLRGQRPPPEHVIAAKKIELESIAKFVHELQRYKKPCPLASRNLDTSFPFEHRCKKCVIDNESDEEDGLLFKKKRATPQHPRGSLELHLSDKVYYYHLGSKDIEVFSQTSLVDNTESCSSDSETEIESSQSEGGSTDHVKFTKKRFDCPKCAPLEGHMLGQLLEESKRADKRLECYRNLVNKLCSNHKAEERLFRQTTKELLNHYSNDRYERSRTDERFEHPRTEERYDRHRPEERFDRRRPEERPDRQRPEERFDRRRPEERFDRRRPEERFDRRRPDKRFDHRPTGERFHRYRTDERFERCHTDDRSNHYKYKSNQCPIHSPKLVRRSFDDSKYERAHRYRDASPKDRYCERCMKKKGEMPYLQKPCTSLYMRRPPTPWTPISCFQETSIADYLQNTLWPRTSKRY